MKNFSILIIIFLSLIFISISVKSQDDLSDWESSTSEDATAPAKDFAPTQQAPTQQIVAPKVQDNKQIAPIQQVQVQPTNPPQQQAVPAQQVAPIQMVAVQQVAPIQKIQVQPTPAPKAAEAKEQPVKKESNRFHLFKKNEQIAELEEKQRKEKEELKEKIKKEKLEAIEKEKADKAELKKKQETEKANKKVLNDRVNEYKKTARNDIYERNKKIRETKYEKRLIEIITDENDPIYIKEAKILDSKTAFLKIRNVEHKYKLELLNQTPKIINSALIIWERKIPFTESLTIAKETRISKPIVPYEKRIVEYNDLNSKREGETYRVKIAKVIFEDGTQWKNPEYKEMKL